MDDAFIDKTLRLWDRTYHECGRYVSIIVEWSAGRQARASACLQYSDKTLGFYRYCLFMRFIVDFWYKTFLFMFESFQVFYKINPIFIVFQACVEELIYTVYLQKVNYNNISDN